MPLNVGIVCICELNNKYKMNSAFVLKRYSARPYKIQIRQSNFLYHHNFSSSPNPALSNNFRYSSVCVAAFHTLNRLYDGTFPIALRFLFIVASFIVGFGYKTIDMATFPLL